MTEERWRRPESVLVVVYTRGRDVLLLERTQPRGFWQSVTGTMQWGESHAQAAARELREETGLAADGLLDAKVERRFPILPAWRPRYASEVEENTEHLWYLELEERVPVTLDPAEHAAHEWLPLAAAAEKVASWTNRAAIRALRR